MTVAWRVLVVIGLAIAAGSQCAGDTVIRVGVLRVLRPETVTVSDAAGVVVSDSSGKQQRVGSGVTVKVRGQGVEVSNGRQGGRRSAYLVVSGGSGAMTLKSARVTARFRGRVRFSSRDGRLLVVNEVRLEDYVRGVVASEMRPDWPAEALKAQAVLARTLAIQRLGEHRREGFDICDTTHCQVYRGVTAETSSTDAAVCATSGRILIYNGEPIQALYCSCCGGVSAAAYGPQSLGRAPYLRVRKDTLGGAYACQDSPHFDWEYSVPAADLAAALRSDSRTSPGARLADLRMLREDASSRAIFVSVKGERSREVDGYVLWNVICRKLGWGSVKSTRFRVAKSDGAYLFRGHGLGHGIGMCQWGSRARAKAGWSYRRILEFYYPGVKEGKP